MDHSDAGWDDLGNSRAARRSARASRRVAEPAPPPGAWETFPHGADVGVRGYGADLAEAFANAAVALTAVITDPNRVRPLRAVELACRAPDREILLLDWLNAVVLAMAVEGLIFGRYEVDIQGDRLSARAFGEPVDVHRHAPAAEVKGATLTELKVRQDGGRWLAQCVVDV